MGWLRLRQWSTPALAEASVDRAQVLTSELPFGVVAEDRRDVGSLQQTVNLSIARPMGERPHSMTVD